ncbi:hypothetical protein BKA70DRAFT_1038012, partial [Coprinopsis sp. MPI-PUGE-AT-0042]
KDIARLHGVVLPLRPNRSGIKDIFMRHTCENCPRFLTTLEVVPSKKSQKREINKKAYQKKVASKDKHLPQCMRVDTEDVQDDCKFPPKPLSAADMEAIVSNACKKLQPSSFEEEGCAVCGMLSPTKSMSSLKSVKGHLKILEVPGITRKERKAGSASRSGAGHSGPVLDTSCSKVCQECRRFLIKGELPKFALANGFWIGKPPAELTELRYVERLIVAKVRHSVCWATVASGGKKMKANVICYEVSVPKVYSMLPPPREDLEEVLAILFTGPSPPTPEGMKRTPFLVRRNHVRRALDWLILNHSDYADVQISEHNLAGYPEDMPPVYVEYVPKLGNKDPTNTSVNDMEEEDGTSDGDCLFTVHGITG